MALTESTPILNRSLSAAQKAYVEGDPNASKVAHALKSEQRNRASRHPQEEKHEESGEYVKAAVFGGLDGILTSFAVVAGASGGGLGSSVVLIVGFSNLVAGALSMGAGEYLSSKAEVEYTVAERNREAWEMKSNPEGEITEMVDIYVARGMNREDACLIVRTMAKYENLFVDIMMAEELGLMVPKPSLLISSFVMFVSFVAFGSIPLLSFACLPAHWAGYEMTAAVLVTGLALGVLGAIKAVVGSSRWWASSAETIVLGSVCALIAYLVGNFVENISGNHSLAVT